MTKLIQRSCRAPKTERKCHITSAPAEIRLAIYKTIALCGFLPYTPYRDYIGLFLSCKLISGEMKHESLRIAPEVLRAIHESPLAKVLEVRPLRPVDFSSLMHVTVGIPRWALFSSVLEEDIFQALGPLLKLHLSSLTIGIENLESEFGLCQLLNELNRNEVREYMVAHRNARTAIVDAVNRAKYYHALTTYADIVGLATAINCLVAPQLCNGKHDEANHWCIRSTSLSRPPGTTCNVRKIILRLKKLHDEVPCGHCGKAPHHIYPFNSVRMRWSPTDESYQLYRNGWISVWTDEYGTRKIFSKQNPAQFIWVRVPEKQKSGLVQAVKRVLKAARRRNT
ncbi:Nn.00g021320.m01.CDS01 [Neocucurbitaria sp. VM-36]